MAGRPQMQGLEKLIADAGGDDVIFDRVAAGEPIASIMESFGFARTFYYRWVKNGGPERLAARDEAMAIRAHSLADEAGDILDKAEEEDVLLTPAVIQLRRERANHRRWLASKLSPETYGDKQQVDVNATMGFDATFLQALRQTGLGHGQVAAGEGPPLLEGEVEEIPNDG